MALAVAPYTGTYASRTPYITADEYTNSPTAVDISQLVPGAATSVQTQALVTTIARASSWVDSLCHQVLAATTDTEYGRYRVNRWGYIAVPCRFRPVLEVDSVKVGPVPSQLVAMDTTSAADIVIHPTGIVDLPVVAYPFNSTSFGYSGIAAGDRYLVQMSYVNGYPNTLLAGAVAADAPSFTVDSALGIYAGTVLTVYDGSATEQTTVTSVSGSTVTAPLVNAHSAGVSVSALPPAVKQAAVSLTSALIKTRGAEAIVLDSIHGEPSRESLAESGGLEDVAVAVDLLAPFRRVY